MIKKIYDFFMLRIVSGLNWTGLKYFLTGREYDLTDNDIERVCEFLLRDNFVGLTYRKTHFTSYPIVLAHWLVTGNWKLISHAWINVDKEEFDSSKIRIFESISKGTIVSPFWKVLNCDTVILLKPKHMTDYGWSKAMEYVQSKLGTKYDALCNEENDDELNCVELVVDAILNEMPWALPNLKVMIKKYKCLTPQMLLECGDFKICLEIRR